jgi:hypothetical protein
MTPESTKYGSEILQITPDNQIILQESILKMLSINGEFESDTKMLKVQEPRVNEIKFE